MCVCVRVLGLGLSVKVSRGQSEASKCTIFTAGEGQAAVNQLTDQAWLSFKALLTN